MTRHVATDSGIVWPPGASIENSCREVPVQGGYGGIGYQILRRNAVLGPHSDSTGLCERHVRPVDPAEGRGIGLRGLSCFEGMRDRVAGILCWDEDGRLRGKRLHGKSDRAPFVVSSQCFSESFVRISQCDARHSSPPGRGKWTGRGEGHRTSSTNGQGGRKRGRFPSRTRRSKGEEVLDEF